MKDKFENLPHKLYMVKLTNASRSDVETLAKNYIEKYFENPSESYYFFKKYENEYYLEIQELGSGKGFLSSILKAIENGENKIIIPTMDHFMEVNVSDNSFNIRKCKGSENGEFSYSSFLERTNAMKPYHRSNNGLLAVGISVFIMGICVLLSSYIIYKVSSQLVTESNVKLRENSFFDRITEIQEVDNFDEDSYISRFYYENGNWQIDISTPDIIPNNEEVVEIDPSVIRGVVEDAVILEPELPSGIERRNSE